jgi:site-specific DNA-methyltransferase (adenine-specific)
MSLIFEPQVFNGDCLEYLTKMDTGSVDLALIDAPYFDYKTGHRQDKEDKLSQSLVQQSQQDQIRTVRECIRVLKDGSAFFYFTNWQEAWWFQRDFHSFLRNEIIWDKGNWTAGDLKGSFGNRYEVIFLGIKGRGWEYKGKRLHDIWGNALNPDETYNLNRVGTKRIHSTEKPVDLYKKIIELSTEEGDIVIDPYGGSGASAIAALETKRNMLMYEIDPEYYQRIKGRIEEWQKNR